jgi:hypothetical protein
MRTALVLSHTLYTLTTNSPLENLCVAVAAFAITMLVNTIAGLLKT